MKKINLILIGFGIGLTLNYNIGIALIIPVILYYGKKDLRNLILIIPPILCSTAIYTLDNILFTSQDYELVNTVANRIIELTPDGMIDRSGTYEEFVEYKKSRGDTVISLWS